LESRLQSEDRAHRIGQKKSVTYVDLIAPDTIDEKIVEALRNKINLADQVLNEETKNWLR
jgi:SNF2 family DNA or RNA helicase